jgi:hypothetical protein
MTNDTVITSWCRLIILFCDLFSDNVSYGSAGHDSKCSEANGVREDGAALKGSFPVGAASAVTAGDGYLGGNVGSNEDTKEPSWVTPLAIQCGNCRATAPARVRGSTSP